MCRPVQYVQVVRHLHYFICFLVTPSLLSLRTSYMHAPLGGRGPWHQGGDRGRRLHPRGTLGDLESGILPGGVRRALPLGARLLSPRGGTYMTLATFLNFFYTSHHMFLFYVLLVCKI